jgi:hypothetical protein
MTAQMIAQLVVVRRLIAQPLIAQSRSCIDVRI